jgi:hypothetical protein
MLKLSWQGDKLLGNHNQLNITLFTLFRIRKKSINSSRFRRSLTYTRRYHTYFSAQTMHISNLLVVTSFTLASFAAAGPIDVQGNTTRVLILHNLDGQVVGERVCPSLMYK